MRFFLFIVFLFLFTANCFADAKQDSLFAVLKSELNRKSYYDGIKEKELSRLKIVFNKVKPDNFNNKFNACFKIYEEYRAYKYDSAYVYAEKLSTLSLQAHDPGMEEYSKSNMAFILLSSGKFKEAFGLLQSIDKKYISSNTIQDYYSVMSRAYFDMANYDNDIKYSPFYRAKGSLYLDSAIQMSKPDSYGREFMAGYQNFQNGNNEAAIQQFLALPKRNNRYTIHQEAVISSILSELYQRTNQPDIALNYLIIAAIRDLQASTKETLALFNLAEMVSRNGNVDDAYLYIQEALKDAEFYGARQRQVQISSILPLLTANKLKSIENEKKHFLIYLFSTLFLTLLVIGVSIQLYKQLQQRKAKERIIEQNSLRLEAMNNQLVEVNQQMVQANRKLDEDAHIKEEYIGYFFHIISGYISKLERLKISVEAKLVQNKVDQIQHLLNEIAIHKERDDLFKTFDKVFLKMFPNFIGSFNALFSKEDQIWPKDHEALTTDLRIFALIRLGVDDSETIGRILEYSAKTVYVYKMRLKAKSIFSSDEFDEKLMNIKITDIAVKVVLD